MAPSIWDTPRRAKDDLTNQIKDRLANRLDKTVYVKSDARAKYGDVVAVVDEIRSAGVDQVGLLTEKNQKGWTAEPSASGLRVIQPETRSEALRSLSRSLV